MEPGNSAFLVRRRFEVFEDLREHVAEECQEFIDPEVVHLVPVLVQDVNACLEPLFLALSVGDAIHDLADFEGGLPLVD